MLSLKGYTFSELFTAEGLSRLDAAFLKEVKKISPTLYEQLLQNRSANLTGVDQSECLIAVARILDVFLAELFQIETETARLQAASAQENIVFAFKKYYVLRESRRHNENVPAFSTIHTWLLAELAQQRKIDDLELSIAQLGQHLLHDPEKNKEKIEKLIQWCAAALYTEEGRAFTHTWMSFKLPKKLDFAHLVETECALGDPEHRLTTPEEKFRARDGFHLTDPRMSERAVANEIHYCVYCHKTEGDFCSKGFPIKKTEPELGFKKNPLDELLTGCPLEEKISEMHVLKRDGFTIASLAMVMVENPMCPATGHRICNDCMKACIYQKQEPVNIPEIETRVLVDVLNLPWGVEIYDLLTRWNPLRSKQWVMKPYNGKKVLVMGMGPAGFTLAHHLLMEGCAVVGMDGLKIEPLEPELLTQPILSFEKIKEDLAGRVMRGFGGVAEYGITVRWDKNFLKLIYLTLARRPYFQVFGNVRFGGTLQVDDAWKLGFDHLAIAVGAGLAKELPIPHSLAPGMRQANDFLMSLQLTGAAKEKSLANLQIRLPAVVIGGGLTGIDTATEIQAYYIKQVEKISHRIEKLISQQNEEKLSEYFSTEEWRTLQEMVEHGKAVKKERETAKKENRAPRFVDLIRRWGGVTIVYRRTLEESPAYRGNYEEVSKAMEEGIYYLPNAEPLAARLDEDGNVCALDVVEKNHEHPTTLPARSILIATGAKPNIAYEFEHRGTFQRNGFEYQSFRAENNILISSDRNTHCKDPSAGIFTSYAKEDHRVTFLGDTNPVFSGNVVKAIASGKFAYLEIIKTVSARTSDTNNYSAFRSTIEKLFSAKIISIQNLAEDAVELILEAPMAAQQYQPGQFYRIQNYEYLAPEIQNTKLQSEALALLGAPVPNHPDQLSFIVLQKGVSSKLVSYFKAGEPIALMGPTGNSTRISTTPETVFFIGGTLASIHLRALYSAYRTTGHRLVYLGYHQPDEPILFKKEIPNWVDTAHWFEDTAKITSFLEENKADLIWVIGDAELLHTIQCTQKNIPHHPKILASVYGPMQCMLKGVCAQCLQWQIDPETGARTKAVYACSWSHQPLEIIETSNLDERLHQNSMQEKLNLLWLEHLENP